jgi:hypothetical protein
MKYAVGDKLLFNDNYFPSISDMDVTCTITEIWNYKGAGAVTLAYEVRGFPYEVQMSVEMIQKATRRVKDLSPLERLIYGV